MQEVPIGAVQVIAIVGIDSIAAVHGETPMTTIAGAGAIKTAHVAAHNTGMNASANTNTDMIASSDGSDVSPAKPTDMTHTAAEVSTIANATQPGDVSTAAKSTDMSTAAHTADVSAAAEAAAHTARVATATEAATTATARFCLRSKQARRQQGRRQNRYHLSHHFLHPVMEWCAPSETPRHQRL
jgi:hypothetical protein